MSAPLWTQLTGTGNLTKLGAGTLILQNNNTLSGTTTVNGGMLQAASGYAGAFGTTSIVVASGTLDLGGNTIIAGGAGVTFNGGVVQNGTLNYGYAGGQYSATGGTVSANLGGPAGLNMTGPGLLLLSAANTYSGSTTVSGGTLQIGNGGSGEYLASPTISNNSTLVFDHADAMTYSGAISGGGQVVVSGGGTQVLSGSNSYSGGTTIGGGTLQMGSALALGATNGSLAVNSPGALDLNGHSATVAHCPGPARSTMAAAASARSPSAPTTPAAPSAARSRTPAARSP